MTCCHVKLFATRNPAFGDYLLGLRRSPLPLASNSLGGRIEAVALNGLKWEPWRMKKWSSFKLGKNTIFASFGLGWPWRSDLRSSKSRSLSNLRLQSRSAKMLPSVIFESQNGTYQLAASEVAEAGLIWSKTKAPMKIPLLVLVFVRVLYDLAVQDLFNRLTPKIQLIFHFF